MPQNPHEAILLSDLINKGEPLGDWGTEHQWPSPRIRKGDWSAAQFYDGVLAHAVHLISPHLQKQGSGRPNNSAISNQKGGESAMPSYAIRRQTRLGLRLFFGITRRTFRFP